MLIIFVSLIFLAFQISKLFCNFIKKLNTVINTACLIPSNLLNSLGGFRAKKSKARVNRGLFHLMGFVIIFGTGHSSRHVNLLSFLEPATAPGTLICYHLKSLLYATSKYL
jgi:hypothetical protein